MNQEIHLDGYAMRPATLEDAEAVAAMINACSLDLTGEQEMTVSDVLTDWQTPGYELAGNARVVETPDGQLAGYGQHWDVAEPHVRRFAYARVHPAHRGRGIGTALTRWVEQRAHETLHTAPAGARVALGATTLVGHEPGETLLRDLGFEPVRYFWRMVRELDAALPEPQWPDGVRVRTMQPGEERAFFRLLDDAFADHWGHVDQPLDAAFERWQHYLHSNPHYDPALFFVVENGTDGEFAGAAYGLSEITEDPAMGWVSMLGVARGYRQQGIGLALLLHSFREFYERGQQRVGLAVDADSLTGATRLYEKAGMHVAQRIVAFEKELRPGTDLTRQSIEG